MNSDRQKIDETILRYEQGYVDKQIDKNILRYKQRWVDKQIRIDIDMEGFR